MRQWQTWAGKQQNPNKPIDAIFCCVGGGGLIAGVVSYIKRIYPDVRVIGVETWDANSMEASLRAGHRVELSEVGLFADGAAVRVVGEEPFRVCYGNRACETGSDCGSANSAMDIDGVDEMVLVSNDEICAAIKDVFIDTRTVLEPAGALGVAGLKKWVAEKGIVGGTFVAITSGANMNFDRLRFVADRAGYGEEREALISVTIPERPGR
jgi:threonine dehydratase